MYRQFIAFAAACVFMTGCVSIPVKSPTKDIQGDELDRDVRFLSQPAFKGRKAGSWESAAVRRFLVQRFEQYGLVPWAGCEGYEQKFRFGTNVIGVLPGSDPNLADQIVLISAHYDHIGVQKWKTCPGAYDNAAAVAVLLEIAESLSLSETKPKRPVCFAAFDAEEISCLGSFAFTCREDYDDSKIAAAINMDLLGRDMLDVVGESLFVTGTENYARIEDKVSDACAKNDLRFIPLGSDLIGPVGDHIAFTSSRRPVLFFTCGINKDYHQPTDTADKLNFGKLKQESEVVRQTLLALADADCQLLERTPAPITRQTADSFVYILDKIRENKKTFKLEPNDVNTLDEIIAKTKSFDPNTMTRDQLLSLERESLGKLLPLLKNYNKTLSRFSEWFVEISKLYAINPEELTEACRQMVRYYLTHKFSVLGSNEYAYCGNLPVNKKSWGLTKISDDEYFFGFFDAEVTFQFNVSILAGMSFRGGLNYKLAAMKGPLPGIVEAAFLGKPEDPNGFEGALYCHYSPAERKPKKEDIQNSLTERQKSLYQALQAAIDRKYPDDITAERMVQLRSEPNILNIFLTPDEGADFGKGNESEMERQSIQTLKDTSAGIEYRVSVMDFLIYRKTKKSMTAIVETIDDRTPYRAEQSLMFEEDYPLRYHPIVSDLASQKEQRDKKYKDKTLGQIAIEKLKKATKKDFGSDKEAWKQWVKRHY